MDWQTIINIAGGACLSALGWFARQVWDSVQELRKQVHQIEIALPSNYVKRVDVDTRFDKIENMLEKIFDRLDQKVDK